MNIVEPIQILNAVQFQTALLLNVNFYNTGPIFVDVIIIIIIVMHILHLYCRYLMGRGYKYCTLLALDQQDVLGAKR